MLKFAVLCLALAAFPGAPLTAATLPEPLEIALQELEARKSAAGELRFTFKVRTLSDEKDYELRFDPVEEQLWTLVSPESKEAVKVRDWLAERDLEKREQGEGPDQELLAGNLREIIDGSAELIDSSAERRLYRFKISESAEFLGNGRSFDASKHLVGEIAISSGTPRLLSLRFFADKSFKPVIVARIKNFDLTMFYEPIWDDGPYVMVRQAIEVGGSAFFKSFEEKTRISYSGFERR